METVQRTSTSPYWTEPTRSSSLPTEFTNHLASAKEFMGFEDTKAELKALQDETGYFQDLQVYIKDEDNKAHRPDERDMMPW